MAPIALAFVALSALAAGCGGPRNYTVRGSQRDPGADAQLQVERIEGGNHLITFTGRNMTPPERLGSGLSRYVIWVRQGSAAAQMEANVAYDPSSRSGRATATTPHQRFTVLVTAERAQETGTPSEHVIFTQNVSP
ncbi:MAG: fibronectin type III domain-containing protein [Myxococcota bacterium]|nr:fibronectin type III domain-containing protein [Myxococcota bacterium]